MSDAATPGLVIPSHRHECEVWFDVPLADVLATHDDPMTIPVVDENIVRLYPPVRDFVDSRPSIVLEANETTKSFAFVSELLQRFVDMGVTRGHRLLAIGGGVIQDITSFTASIYMRGVDWVFVPTNLLSQCDSCIGSKTSINFGPYKNQLGTFFPARSVFIDTAFLDTLPEFDRRSGFGEMMHYALVSGQGDYEFFASRLDKARDDRACVEELIRRSLGIKSEMVAIDEFDRGPRNVFNYGHSFGHALETATAHEVPHGIAVSWGMDLANVISADLGLIPMATRDAWRETLEKVWRDTELPAFQVSRYVQALSRDKKNVGSDVRVILTRGVGEMFRTTLDLGEVGGRIASYFEDRLYDRPLA